MTKYSITLSNNANKTVTMTAHYTVQLIDCAPYNRLNQAAHEDACGVLHIGIDGSYYSGTVPAYRWDAEILADRDDNPLNDLGLTAEQTAEIRAWLRYVRDAGTPEDVKLDRRRTAAELQAQRIVALRDTINRAELQAEIPERTEPENVMVYDETIYRDEYEAAKAELDALLDAASRA